MHILLTYLLTCHVTTKLLCIYRRKKGPYEEMNVFRRILKAVSECSGVICCGREFVMPACYLQKGNK